MASTEIEITFSLERAMLKYLRTKIGREPTQIRFNHASIIVTFDPPLTATERSNAFPLPAPLNQLFDVDVMG